MEARRRKEMKKLFSVAIALMVGSFFFPLTMYAQSEKVAASNAPPISQTLVAEGDFAMQLATALKLGTPATEEQAEDMLVSVDIAPKNGWIADYPMTPIIVGEVQNAVIAAAAQKKISMGNNEALQAFMGLTTQFGLAVTPAGREYAENAPSGQYVPPSDLENYYDQQGPPVVSYYPPPSDYDYLYTWVPYPFFVSDFFFPGFFVLNDFDLIVFRDHFHHDHDFHHRIANHFLNPRTHEFARVDPTTRTMGRALNASLSRDRAFTSLEGRRGASSIVNRSQQRFAALNRTTGGRFQGATPASRSFMPSGRSFSGGSSFGMSHGGGFGGFRGGGFHGGGFHGGGRR